MDNSNNVSNNLLQSLNASSQGISTESSSNSFFSWIQNISPITWILIIIVLAFLGVNIFSYLAQGTQDVTNIFQPLIQKIGGLFGNVTGQIVNVSAEGAKEVVNDTSGVITSGLTGIQQVSQGQSPIPSASMAPTTNPSVPVQTTMPQPSIYQTNALNTALNTSTSQSPQNEEQNYQADEASSTIQSASSGKAGWCYIGEDRGIRSCAQVGVNETCMSGDIFPSQDICINPSLRA